MAIEANSSKKFDAIGTLVALGAFFFLFSLIPALSFLIYLSAFSYWCVLLSSLRRLNRRNRQQVIFLLGAGVTCGVLAVFMDMNALSRISTVFRANLGITSMLVGVSFLSLIPNSRQAKSDVMQFKGAISTWGSVHLLGSVINLSSVFLVGDRLQRIQPMNDAQLSVIVRALTSAGFWSPFFASMAVAFSVAPNAVYSELILVGIPVATIAFMYSLWELSKKGQIAGFVGFPMTLTSLFFPVLLASLVLMIHYKVFEELAILSIVTFVCPLSVISFLLLKSGPTRALSKLGEHASSRLANMVNEISLFLSAGFMSASVALLVGSLLGEEWALFEYFGFWAALSCYLAICATALLGLHPIVGISVMSAFVPFSEVNNTLLAFVCLGAWGVGTAIGPLSGINLSVAGKYQVDNFRLSRLNIGYGLFMSVIVAVAMAILVQLHVK